MPISKYFDKIEKKSKEIVLVYEHKYIDSIYNAIIQLLLIRKKIYYKYIIFLNSFLEIINQ